MTVSILTVVAFVAAGLLVAAGAAKFARPMPMARALYTAGLPARSTLVRGIGLTEIGVGTWFLLSPSWTASVTLATMYVVFAGFVGFLLVARPDAASCGCAGASDVPPSVIHLALNTLAAAAAAAAALDPPAGLPRTLASLGLASLPFALGLLTAAVLSIAAVMELQPALDSYRRPAGHPVETDSNRHLRADAALTAANVGPGHPSLWPGTPEVGGPPTQASPLPTESDA